MSEGVGDSPPLKKEMAMPNRTSLVKRGDGDFHQAYRPCRISEVYGRDEIKAVIKDGLDNERLPHAVLLHGESGTGKTTIARIIALGLNCDRGPTSEPCCECANCRGTIAGNSLAFLEQNSADLNGVENMRRLRGDFNSAPLGGGDKKIYLFDESHGLSKPSQNILLKSVEDSRDHLFFLFCSTEPEGVIQTLRNRCMEFEFTALNPEVMWDLLFNVLSEEDYRPNMEVMEEIVEKVEGRPRNALHELQRAIFAKKFYKMEADAKKIMENVKYVLGASAG